MPEDLKLYHYWRSSSSWRVRWALAYKEIPYQSIAVNLLKSEQLTPEFKQISPTQQVPALVVGGRAFSESMAILEYLEEIYPAPNLLPASSIDRLAVRQFCLMIAAGIQPIQNLKVLKYVEQHSLPRTAFARYWIQQGLQPLEEILKETAGTYCFGGHLSFADLFLIPQCYNAERFGVNLSSYPNIQKIYRNCLRLASCEASAPHKQEGAEAH